MLDPADLEKKVTNDASEKFGDVSNAAHSNSLLD